MTFDSWLQTQLRMISYKYLPRNAALKNARVARGRYKCAHCKQVYKSSDVQLDHVVPVIDPRDGFVDWNTYIARLFVPIAGWQVLCKACHLQKTNDENVVRRKIKKEK